MVRESVPAQRTQNVMIFLYFGGSVASSHVGVANYGVEGYIWKQESLGCMSILL
jgi:hypothetical protein